MILFYHFEYSNLDANQELLSIVTRGGLIFVMHVLAQIVSKKNKP
ncbi:hypothetical protein VIBNISFn118_1610008 [Vibrio nigripulchritudo SFn118]|nr:hypothetical protein VIBNISFn118_1610008 [Vibrio nigripulchritudo SFn118]